MITTGSLVASTSAEVTGEAMAIQWVRPLVRPAEVIIEFSVFDLKAMAAGDL
jgi:hypothetical protein